MQHGLHNIRLREGQWHYRFKFRGREYTGPTGLDGTDSNQSAAEEYARMKRAELRGEQTRRELPFETAAGAFVAWCETVEYRAKPATAARIKTSFTSLVAFFGKTPARQLAEMPGLIEDYKQWRIVEHQVRDVTLRHDLHALSLFFGRYAIKRGLADLNPLSKHAREMGRGVTIPSDADAIRMHPLTAHEEELYFERAGKLEDRDLYDVAKIVLLQGARHDSEILCRRKEDYNTETGELRITNGKTRAARRTLHCISEVREILERRMRLPGPWLFPSPARGKKGKAGGHRMTLQRPHDRVCAPEPTPDDPEPEQLNFTLYDLRHTFGTRMATQTDPFTLAALMGHANLRTIMRYVHPQDAAKKAAMERFEEARNRAKLKVVGA